MDPRPPTSGDFGAYGSGGATGEFDPWLFVKKPQVIVRAIGWVCAVVVLGCISSQGWDRTKCLFNLDTGACGFGTAVSAMAFMALLTFIALDALFDNLSNAQHRKYIVIADISVSGFLSFMWFVCFCYLADAWRKTDYTVIDLRMAEVHKSALEATIAFSFFSLAAFVVLTTMAIFRYREGVTSNADLSYNQQSSGSSPF